MKHFSSSMILLFVVALSGVSQAQDEISVLEGPYLGQKPPGLTPERFAPGIVSTEHWEYGGTFTPDLREFYLLREGGKYENASFVVFRYEYGEWSESVISHRVGQPFISPDGMTMHLGRRYKERAEIGWSEVKELEAPFKDLPIMRLTASTNGTFYFDTFNKDQLDFPIRYSRLVDGKYEAPKLLSEAINTGTYLNHPFIAPDESYLLWDAKREDGYGDSDIYISFRQKDGSWGAAINLGNEINTDAWEASASVTPDGKYLFFSRNMGSDDYENVDIYWVDAQVIENHRPKSDIATEAVAEQVEYGFWANPDVEYVSTAWPIGDDHKGPVKIWDVPMLEGGFIDTAPADRKDGIMVGELGVDGGNKDMIVKLAQEMSDGQHGDFDSLLIAHKGKLLFESYYSRGRINLTHPQASATKTYTSLALGRAIQLGYLTMADLDKPVISFLKELDPTKFVEGAERVTLHRALTMHTGISISKEQREAFDKYPDQVEGQSLVQAIFEQSGPITPESQSSFVYDNYATPLVMQVIEAVVPGTAEDFIKNELLGKMGITTYEWLAGLGGLPAGGWKSSFSSRAMAKFGTLAMNRGKWNGEQLIPETYISKATSRILHTGDDDIFGGGEDVSNAGYGYFWWSGDLQVGDKRFFSTSAQGGSGQYIILIEKLNLVVVATGSHRGGGKTLQIAAERILPAFVQ